MGASFSELIDEAAAVPITAWDFSWLDGRAIEDRPSWRYFDRVAEHMPAARRMLDVETGVGNLIADLPTLAPVTVATEAYPPSIERAWPRLRRRGAHLLQTVPGDPTLPVRDEAFDLVTSRHPIDTSWSEIARVLEPGGQFVSQQVGPRSVIELTERLMGPQPPSSRRDPALARRSAEAAGFVVERLEVERPRTVFFDIGAVVYFLRLVVWIVPDFDVDRYREELRSVHEHIEREGSFETTASRFLIEARKQ
jgi:SAM-dependent methyltransferase